MSETTYDTELDDSGYSEPYTFSDFCKEMYGCTLGFTNKFEIFWNTLKRESQPIQLPYRPKDSWWLGVYRWDGIYENNFTSKLIHE